MAVLAGIAVDRMDLEAGHRTSMNTLYQPPGGRPDILQLSFRGSC